MKTKTITYSKTFALQGYSNEKIEVTINLDKGESPKQVFDKAKAFVETMHKQGGTKEDRDLAVEALAKIEVLKAQQEELINNLNDLEDGDLPF